MRIEKFALGITAAATISLAGPQLALASGNGKPIRECTTQERSQDRPAPRSLSTRSPADDRREVLVLELNLPFVGDPWAGYDASEGFPNDTVQSVRVGTAVRTKLFWNWFYTHDDGAPYSQAAGTWQNLGSPWAETPPPLAWSGHRRSGPAVGRPDPARGRSGPAAPPPRQGAR
jgi:hypothetical protein